MKEKIEIVLHLQLKLHSADSVTELLKNSLMSRSDDVVSAWTKTDCLVGGREALFLQLPRPATWESYQFKKKKKPQKTVWISHGSHCLPTKSKHLLRICSSASLKYRPLNSWKRVRLWKEYLHFSSRWVDPAVRQPSSLTQHVCVWIRSRCVFLHARGRLGSWAAALLRR